MDNNDRVSALRGDAIRALTALARHTYANGAQLDFAEVVDALGVPAVESLTSQ